MRHDGAMTSTSDTSAEYPAASRWLRWIAFAEAFILIGLLFWMFFYFVGSPRTEIGVKVFGPIHGGIFLAFVAAALFVGLASAWRVGPWVLALLASVVPLASVPFLLWAERTGRLGPASVRATMAEAGAPDAKTT